MRLVERVVLIFAIATELAVAPSAQAKTTPIDADFGKIWMHKESQAGFPAQAGSFVREAVEDASTTQSDVVVTFRDRESRTLVSVYLFRAGIVDVSLWQDRILQQIVRPDSTLGAVDGSHGKETLFTPASGGVNSGSRVVFSVNGNDTTATGSAVLALDDWMVAVRMTSHKLSRSDLDERLAAFVAALVLPAAKIPPAAVYHNADCADRTQPDKPAKRADMDMASVLILGALQMPAKDDDAELVKQSPAQGNEPLCRLASGGVGFDAYRRGTREKEYFLAFGDAGVVATVAPDISSALLGKGEGNRFSLSLVTSEQSLLYRGFKSMPPVAQVMTVVNGESPLGSTGRAPQNAKTINISAPGK